MEGAVGVPMGGDPAAVEAGAAELEALSGRYTTAGDDVRRSGMQMGASWLGPAASAAQQSVGELGTSTAVPAEVAAEAGRVLRVYAQALREAQQMAAAAEAAGARAAGTATGLADDPPSMQRDVALGRAEADVAGAEAMTAQAVAKEQQANQVAAAAISALADRVDGMVIRTPDPSSAATYVLAGTPGAAAFTPATNPGAFVDHRTETPPPPRPPHAEEDRPWWSDVGHAVLDVGGLVPVLGEPADGVNAAWYAAEGDYLNAGLSGAGAIPFVGWGAFATKWGLRGADAAGDAATTAGRAAPSAPVDRPGPPTTPGDQGTRIGEPVDVGSGHLVLPATDVELPGALPLVLRRQHHSRWRSGRWFGPSWSSTLDEHLLVDADRVHFGHEDAVVVAFPGSGEAAVRGHGHPHLTLRAGRGPDEHVITDAVTGRRRHFTGSGRLRWLTTISDRSGRHRIDVVRDPDGVPREVRHSGGYRVRVHVAQDRVVGFDLDGAGRAGSWRALVRFGHVAGNLTTEVNSSGLPMSYGYDERGRLTGWVDRRGSWFRHRYDEDDRVVAQTGSGGFLSATYRYDASSATVTRTDSLGHETTYVHDDRSRVVREIGPDGAERATVWGEAGPVEERDAIGRVTRTTYDDDGRVLRIERPDGRATEIRRDEAGDPVEVVEADGARWRRSYDDDGRLLSESDPAGGRTTYRYEGRATTVVDAVGATSRLTTDAAGLPVDRTDALGATERWERDAFGRVVAAVDALGGRTRFSWTVEGRPASRTDPLGHVERRVYDPEGNVVAITGPAGHVTTLEYSDFDLLVAWTDAEGGRHAVSRDTEMRVLGVTNPLGLRWSYERDAAGRVVAESDFDGARHTTVRDAVGRIVVRRNATGQEATFAYDELDRLVERRVDGAPTVFAHDPAGRLIRATTPESDLVLERDALGRVVSEAVDGRSVRSAYDALGRRTRRETPSGALSEWTYDAASRPASLTAGEVVTFDHDLAGRETRRVAGLAVIEQHRDAVGRVERQRVPGVVDRAFTYRADGRPTAITTTSGRRDVELDGIGRVLAVTGTGSSAGWAERYRYDPAGTMVDARWPDADPLSHGRRVVDGTRVRRAGRSEYTYDAAGRLITRIRPRLSRRPDVWRYRWDALDRLVGVTTPDGVPWRYVYDGLGRRVAKQRSVHFVHVPSSDAQGRVVERVEFAWDDATVAEQTTSDGRGRRTTTWDHDVSGLRPIAQRETGGSDRDLDQDQVDRRFHGIVTDLVGAPTELLDADGSVAGRSRRTIWGLSAWSGSSTPLEYPGQHADPESGLRYNVLRHYDAETGAYVSPDPLGLAPSPHPRAYVTTPLVESDSLGLAPDGCGGDPRFVQDRDGSWVDTAAPGLADQQNRVVDELTADREPARGGSAGRLPGRPAGCVRE